MSDARWINLSRRQHLLAGWKSALRWGALACLPTGRLAWAVSESSLPVVASLPEALSRALSQREPLVVMVSLQGCAFCKVVRESYLLPMQREGLQVVQINMRENRPIIDFQGKPTTHDQWVRQYNVRIAPTVLFLGRDAQEVAARLKGAYLPDFYNAYLEEQLTLARRAVQKPAAALMPPHRLPA